MAEMSIQIGKGEAVKLVKPDAELTELEMFLLEVKAKRNNLLAESDINVLPDRGLSDAKVVEWKTYRQSLRDFDFSYERNAEINWPPKPE